MKIIEVKESKISKMSAMVEEMLMMGGKLMHCFEELENSAMYGERAPMGMRDNRYSKMNDEDDDRDYEYMRKLRKSY